MNLQLFKSNVVHNAPSVLNKLKRDDDNLPIGMEEDTANPLSCNFSLERYSRNGGCYVLDGSTYIQNLDLSSIGTLTGTVKISCWFKAVTPSLEANLFSGDNTSSTNRNWRLVLRTDGKIAFYIIGATSYTMLTTTDVYGDDEWHYVEATFNRNDYSMVLTVDDDVYTKTSVTDYRHPDAVIITFQHYYTNSRKLTGSVFDCKLEDDNGLWVHYKYDEELGDILYDSSQHGLHGTILLSYSGLHGYQDIKNYQNELGYTISDGINYYIDSACTQLVPNGVIIPRMEDSLKCVAYSEVGVLADLEYVGPITLGAYFRQSNAWLGDGVAQYYIAGLLTTDTITVYGNSDIPICTTDGYLDLADGELAYGVLIQRSSVDWAHITFCEPIINVLNHTSYDISGNGNHALLMNGDTDNEGKQNEYHWLQNGFGLLAYPETNDVVELPQGFSVAGNGQRTLAIRMLKPEDTESCLYSMDTSSGTNYSSWSFLNVNGSPRVDINGAGHTFSNLTMNDVGINNVALTYDGTNLGGHVCYVNGSTEQAHGSIVLNTDNTTSTIFGTDVITLTTGIMTIDELTIWDRKLTLNELTNYFSDPSCECDGKLIQLEPDMNGNLIDILTGTEYQTVSATPLNTLKIPSSSAMDGKDALGIPLNVIQDEKSMLNSGCLLEHVKLEEMKDDFWYDEVNNRMYRKAFSDFTGNTDDRIFSDISHMDKVTNIRTHYNPLTGLNLEDELRITNND